jgi:hypothetical protein
VDCRIGVKDSLGGLLEDKLLEVEAEPPGTMFRTKMKGSSLGVFWKAMASWENHTCTEVLHCSW